MAILQKRLFGPAACLTSPTDSASGRYLVPASTTSIVKEIVACNTSQSSSGSISVAVGTTATAANRILSSFAILPNETVVLNFNLIMTAGEKLYLVGSDSSMSVTVNGIEES